MSWSVNLIGPAQAVKTALEANAGVLSGQNRTEYEAALPHLIALVDLNLPANIGALLIVEANGTASFRQDTTALPPERVHSVCNVNIRPLYGKIVT